LSIISVVILSIVWILLRSLLSVLVLLIIVINQGVWIWLLFRIACEWIISLLLLVSASSKWTVVDTITTGNPINIIIPQIRQIARCLRWAAISLLIITIWSLLCTSILIIVHINRFKFKLNLRVGMINHTVIKK
jgi:hypothetical protein